MKQLKSASRGKIQKSLPLTASSKQLGRISKFALKSPHNILADLIAASSNCGSHDRNAMLGSASELVLHYPECFFHDSLCRSSPSRVNCGHHMVFNVR